MATLLIPGQRTWEGSRDAQGYRTYKIKYIVEADTTDGPANVLQTAGLPAPGAYWAVDNDLDVWAFCHCDATVKPLLSNEPNTFWEVEFTFGTKPPETKSCTLCAIDDPLLEPQKVSGSFVRYSEEAYFDRFGQAVVNSAFEQIRGPQVEFDSNRPQIKIEQNVASLELPLLARLVDTVNAFSLWGLPPRTIKLSNVSWERKYNGFCAVYYTRTLEFDIRYDGFDRDILDEGTKVLHGHWDDATGAWILDNIGGDPPDDINPEHFDRFHDRKGNLARVLLNGHGRPAGVLIGSQDLYMSLNDNNLGNEITDTTMWVPIFGSTIPTEWDPTFDYIAGNIISFEGFVYIALSDISLPVDPATLPDTWRLLGGVENVPTDAGEYSSTTEYEIGQFVQDVSSDKTSAGSIHIEKYGEADFLLLGIPLDF